MSRDDPFAHPDGGDPGDADRTIIRPNPGGRAPARPMPASPAPGPGAAEPEVMSAIARTGLNPLVSAAASLLGLAIRLRGSATQRDVTAFPARVLPELTPFESPALASRPPQGTVRARHYLLRATLDDIVLNPPWRSNSIRPKRGIVSTFHHEVTGGQRF